MKAMDYIRVVLVEPSHPGNIGAVARAMGNMGFKNLILVKPKTFPSEIANARAAGADDILNGAVVVDELDQALQDCTLVFGTTARLRSIEWPSLEPRQAMENAVNEADPGKVAIIFGRESKGLTNAELERCHHLVRIPVDEASSSLNLGAAVMVLLYELRRSFLNPAEIQPGEISENRATSQDMKNFYAHLQSVLQRIDFADGRSTKLQRKLIRLFNRAQPYEQEVKMLRGILTAIDKAVD